MTLRPSRCLVALCLLVSGLGVAHADDRKTRGTAEGSAQVDRAKAKKHFDRGEKLFALGKFETALEQYQLAYDAAPIPDFLFNMGQCHRNLGDYEAAIFSFRKYLKLVPDADDREQVEAYIDELEAEQDKRNSAKFGFEKTPPPDEKPVAGTPVYKKWWFWTAVVAVGAAGGTGVYLATRPGDGPPQTSLGNIVFGK